MGDFSIACALTGLSTMNRRAVLVGLEPYKFANETKSGSHIIPGHGAQSLYVPITLPIYGEVGCYGDFEKVEKDAGTDALESYFSMDIEKLADEFLGGPRSGMLILRDAWDEHTRILYDECSWKPEQALTKTMAQVNVARGQVALAKSQVEELERALERSPRSEPRTSPREQLRSALFSDSQTNYILGLGNGTWSDPTLYFLDVYEKPFMEGKLDDHIARLRVLNWVFLSVNRLFGPTSHGLQYEHPKAINVMSKWVAKYSRERLAQIKRDRDED